MHRKNKPVVALVLCLAALLMLAAAPQARAADDLIVAVIDVEGNKLIPSETILKAITRTQVGDPVDPSKIDLDIQSISTLGYFSRVDWRMERVIGGVKVIFVVAENPPLKAIEVTGLTRISNEELKDLWGIKPGEVINIETINKGFAKVMEYCQQKGVWPKLKEAPAFTADGVIRFNMVELKLGGIKIEGNEKTKEHVIRREISAKDGEIFDTKKFREDLNRLMRMGLFDDIQIPNDKMVEGPGPDEVTLTLVVKERKSRMIGFNFGYSHGIGLTGGLEYSDNNMFGLGQNLSTSLTLQKGASNFEMAYNVPWLGPHHTSLGLEVYSRYEKDLAWTDDEKPEFVGDLFQRRTNGGSVTLGVPLFWDIVGSARLKVEQIHNMPIEGEPKSIPELYSISNRTLTFGATRNKLLLENGYVTGGNLSQVSLENAGGWLLGGDTGFLKLHAETRQFYSFAPKHVLGMRLAGGTVAKNGYLPDTELFIVGGSESLRGYDYRAFTGEQFALMNAEYRYQINQILEGVLFTDLGSAWTASDPGNPFSLKIGYGLGLRINIPMLGQLRFDYGFSPGESGKFYFSFGETF